MNISSSKANAKHLTHPKYRPDIDGLRAVAILSVVGYHAFPFWIQGGFIGVDVFFVISGFLISTIVFGSFSRNAFSFIEFYTRRIKRIFPALLLVLAVSLGFGWFELLADEYKQLGKHVAGGAGFVANFVLWQESGYFDAAAETKPLLHLWSLSIEEQFYFIWPLLIWVAWKKRFNILTTAIVIAIVSFSLNILIVYENKVSAFYSPQTRFWELMAGSVLSYIQFYQNHVFTLIKQRFCFFLRVMLKVNSAEVAGDAFRDIQSFCGAALITLGLILINKDDYFPGWWAIFPTLGTVFIISAGKVAWVNRVVLSNRLLVWFGLISYPLYLWHWPLLTFARIVENGALNYRISIIAVFISIVLAWLTYELVEKPIRYGKYGKTKAIILSIVMIIIGNVGYYTYKQEGIRSRNLIESNNMDISMLQSITEQKNITEILKSELCFQLPPEKSEAWFFKNNCLDIKYPDRPKIFLIGDSHSASLSLALRPFAEDVKLNFIQLSSGWCPPFSNDDRDTQCQEMNRFVRKQIETVKPDLLIVDCHWFHDSEPVFFKGGDYIEYLQNQFYSLKLLGIKKIIIIGQIPTWKSSLPDILLRKYALKGKSIPVRTYSEIEPESIRMDMLMKKINYQQDMVYISLKDVLCNESGCLTSMSPNLDKDLIVWDYGHLTPAGAKYVTDSVIKPKLLELLELN